MGERKIDLFEMIRYSITKATWLYKGYFEQRFYIVVFAEYKLCVLGRRQLNRCSYSHGYLRFVPLALSASEFERKSSSNYSGTSTASMTGRRSRSSSAALLTTSCIGRISNLTRFTLSNKIHGTSIKTDFHVLNMAWYCSWNCNQSYIHAGS